MIHSMKTLIPHLLSAVFLIIAMANTVQSQTISFGYDFSDGVMPTGLSYGGDAYFAPETPYVRLTKIDNSSNALPGSLGAVLYSKYIPLWDISKVTAFETTIKFIIKPNANDLNPADGLAFFIGPTMSHFPVLLGGGNFGLFDVAGKGANLFAVEFDIYANPWDPPYRHVGIDILSRESVAHTQISDDLLGKEVTMRVSYVGPTKMISVVVTSGAERYEVSYEYDLTTVLQQVVNVGISAATGANVAIHEVVSWYFTCTLDYQLPDGKSIRQIMWN